MGYVDDIIVELDQIAISEIMKYGVPSLDDYNDTVNTALELGKILNANLEVIKLGARLMEIKLGQAISEKKRVESVNMCLGFAMAFLTGFPLSEDFKIKVIACIKEQNETSFSCIEAEICTNALCCNSLTPRKLLKKFYNFHSAGYNFEETFLFSEEKAEEKWKKLTLDVCKKKMETNYNQIKEFLSAAKKDPSKFFEEANN